MAPNCSTFLPYPQANPCDHGLCDFVSGRCTCDIGWVDRGDFALGNNENTLCDVSLDAIQGIYITTAIGLAFWLLANIFKLVEIGRKNRISKSTIHLWLPSCIQLFSISTLIPFVGLKIANPAQSIIHASSPATVVFYSLGALFAWMSLHMFVYSVLKAFAGKHMLVMESNEQRRNFERFRRFTLVIIALTLVCAASPILVLVPDMDVKVIQGIHVAGLGLACLFSALSTAWLLRILASRLEQTAKGVGPNQASHTKLAPLAKKLRLLSHYAPQNFFSNFVFTMIFSFWPYFGLSKVTYLIPVGILMISLGGVVQVYVTTTYERGRSSQLGSTLDAAGKKTNTIVITNNSKAPNNNIVAPAGHIDEEANNS